jgi:hypothetical protein
MADEATDKASRGTDSPAIVTVPVTASLTATDQLIDRVARALLQDEYDGGHLSGPEIDACVEEDWRGSRRAHFRRQARIAAEIVLGAVTVTGAAEADAWVAPADGTVVQAPSGRYWFIPDSKATDA